MLRKCSSLFFYISGKIIGVYINIIFTPIRFVTNVSVVHVLGLPWSSGWICLKHHPGKTSSMSYLTPPQVLGVLMEYQLKCHV